MTPLNTTPLRPIDSSTLSEWSEQEIFDYTMSLWAERGFTKAVNEHCSCLYRGSPAGPCLIGMLIPDSGYSTAFEGLPVSRLIDHAEPNMAPERRNFLADLQAVHDSCPTHKDARVRYLNTSIRNFATNRRLTVPAGVEERLNNLGKEDAHGTA